MAIVGGLRARLIRESIFNAVYDALDSLDWFDAGRQHTQISFRSEPIDINQQIPINTIVLTDEDIIDFDQEMGSILAEHRWTMYIDFYAENQALGLQVVRDIRDIISGRFPSTGQTSPHIQVYDYRTSTPSPLFTVEIEDAIVDRARDFPEPWRRFWYAVRFTVVDVYADEDYD